MLYNYCPKCGEEYSKGVQDNFRNNSDFLECPKCGFRFYQNPKPAIGTFILDDMGRLLLTKRSIGPFNGWWDLPGGFLSSKETPEKAIKRKLKEELGLEDDITIGDFIGTILQRYENKGNENEVYYVIGLFYEIKLDILQRQKVRALDEISEIKFFNLKEVPDKIAFEEKSRLVKQYIKNHL